MSESDVTSAAAVLHVLSGFALFLVFRFVVGGAAMGAIALRICWRPSHTQHKIDREWLLVASTSLRRLYNFLWSLSYRSSFSDVILCRLRAGPGCLRALRHVSPRLRCSLRSCSGLTRA